MKRFGIIIILLLMTTQISNAEWIWQRRWSGCGYSYYKVWREPQYREKIVEKPIIKKENTTTIVNNLIGIPVPVGYNQPIAEQGTTVYGYPSLSQFTESYGNLDMALLYNQAARLTDQAQQLAGQANLDFQALVQSEGQHRADVAKIVAQGMAAREALLAAKGEPSQPISRSFTFKVTQNSSGNLSVEKVRNNNSGNFDLLSAPSTSSDAGNVSKLLQLRCVQCHNNKRASGGLNFLAEISDAQQRAVLERVTTDDASKLMPKGGPRLSVSELSLLFRAMPAN